MSVGKKKVKVQYKGNLPTHKCVHYDCDTQIKYTSVACREHQYWAWELYLPNLKPNWGNKVHIWYYGLLIKMFGTKWFLKKMRK